MRKRLVPGDNINAVVRTQFTAPSFPGLILYPLGVKGQVVDFCRDCLISLKRSDTEMPPALSRAAHPIAFADPKLIETSMATRSQ